MTVEPQWIQITTIWLKNNFISLINKNWEFLDFGLKLLGLLCSDEIIFNDFHNDGVIQK